jgi:hypothetical protein
MQPARDGFLDRFAAAERTGQLVFLQSRADAHGPSAGEYHFGHLEQQASRPQLRCP